MNWTTKSDPSGFQIRWCEELASEWLASGTWKRRTLVDVARAAVVADPNHLLQIEGDTRMTRAEVWHQALRVAGFFVSRGLKPGDTVSFQLPNWSEAAVLALAARMCGLILNPIPPIYREADLAHILANCHSRLIFVPGTFRKFDHAAALTKLASSLPYLRDVVVVREQGQLTWETVVSGDPIDEADLPEVDPGAIMMAMYTSGTTGKAKGVLHTHFTFDHRAHEQTKVWRISPDDVIFMPSPVAHITGALWAFDLPWVSGAACVLMDVWGAAEGVATIERNKATISGGATPFLQQMLDVAESRPAALDSLRMFFCGGTTVSPDLIRRANATFPKGLFFRNYGSTEMTSLTLGINGRHEAELGAETDGQVLAPVEVRILDPITDEPLPDGQEGEIVTRGPGLFVGYIDTNENEGAFLPDGFFRMGDLGKIAHGNYLVITGRKKDIIIRSGENISPKEVEDALSNHPSVAEVAIVAMPSATTGEKGCAFVIVRPNATIDLIEIRRFLEAAGLATQKCPEYLVLVDELPRVPSGKVRKDVLRNEARLLGEQP